MNEAAMAALEERQIAQRSSDTPASTATPSTIKNAHFEQALKKISPSVSDKVRDQALLTFSYISLKQISFFHLSNL